MNGVSSQPDTVVEWVGAVILTSGSVLVKRSKLSPVVLQVLWGVVIFNF